MSSNTTLYFNVRILNSTQCNTSLSQISFSGPLDTSGPQDNNLLGLLVNPALLNRVYGR